MPLNSGIFTEHDFVLINIPERSPPMEKADKRSMRSSLSPQINIIISIIPYTSLKSSLRIVKF